MLGRLVLSDASLILFCTTTSYVYIFIDAYYIYISHHISVECFCLFFSTVRDNICIISEWYSFPPEIYIRLESTSKTYTDICMYGVFIFDI